MRIALDARYAFLATGTGTVTFNLLKEILLQDKENEYLVICFQHDPFPTIQAKNIHKYIGQRNFGSIRRMFWEYFFLPRLLNRYHIDVFYSPENFMSVPFWKGKQVITIHDIIPIAFPQYIRKVVRRLRFHLKVRNAMKKKSHIVTISDFTKKEIIEHFDEQKHNITVISEGAEIIKIPEEQAKKCIAENGVRNNYILALGGLEYRKNNEMLVKAYARLPANLLKTYDLVIIGPIKSKIIQMDPFPRISASIMGRVHFISHVDTKKLASFYQNSSLFVYISMYEGFGLPILEAMKYGVPVVCSDRTSIPEVAGTAACMTKIDKVWSVTNAMIKVLRDPIYKEELIQRGYGQAEKFSWSSGAHSLIKIFNSLNK